ncbi:ankyrin repeat domain-containing protein [Wolbachia pipientis]|uniref:ankyrin repeat domain-containing protein n=1 Tax=Wolbachia pipientis TaxID=955 RepID=UPI0038B55544
MEYEQWSDILSTISADNESSVIEKIKEKLKEKDEGEYEKWERANFDINYQFECKGYKFMLSHCAAEYSHKDVVEVLLRHNAEVNARNEKGETPLHCTTGYGRKDVIEVLLQHNAEVNARNEKGETPLHHAAAWNDKVAVEVLLRHNAEVNAEDESGGTHLHLAAADYGHEDVVEVLIQETLIQDFSVQRPGYLAGAFSTYWDRCLDEVKKLEEENKLLYDFLKESNTEKLFEKWEKNGNENVRSKFDNQKSLQEQYPEYAHILINKANEVKKEIFLHNHKPLIDVLSQLGYREGNTPDRIRAFLEENRDRFKVELGNPNRSLIDFVSFEDVKALHVPKLELRAVVSQIIGKDTPSRNLLNPNSEQYQAVGLLYS